MTTPPVDTDDLPAAQYLILEVLAARYRTGERTWTFPARLRRQVEALADVGLVGWKSGVAPKTVIAWLTDAGKAAAMSATYVSPNAEQVTAARAQAFRDAAQLVEDCKPESTNGGSQRALEAYGLSLATALRITAKLVAAPAAEVKP